MEPSVAPALHVVRCPQCRQALSGGAGNAAILEICPGCRSELRIRRFASSSPRSESLGRSEAAVEGEAVCFFHPEKKAVRGCERCGRFVCALCDMPLGTRHLCPSCVGSGLESDKVPELISRRFVWGGFALWLGLLPLLLSIFVWPLFVLTGPAAVFVGLWGWKKPGSVVHGRRRWAAVFGIVFGLIQVTIVLVAVLAVWKGASRG